MTLSPAAVRGLIRKLSHSQQEELFQDLRPWIDQMGVGAKAGLNLQEFRERRFHAGLKCPHCNDSKVKKNGTFLDKRKMRRQRYLCKVCGKAFGDFTGTPLAGTHRADLWPAMTKRLLDGRSLRQTAAELGISLGTAFAWRHKLLAAHRDGKAPNMTGIVEADETFFRVSNKGKRGLKRKPRRRGEVPLHWEPKVDLACVVVAQDRRGQSAARHVGRGQRRGAAIRRLLEAVMARSATLCSDGAQVYRKFCKDKGIRYRCVMPRKRLKKGAIYHLNHVNNWHSRFKSAVNHRFKGVATKYLDNYAAWQVLCDKVKAVNPNTAAKRAIFEACAA